MKHSDFTDIASTHNTHFTAAVQQVGILSVFYSNCWLTCTMNVLYTYLHATNSISMTSDMENDSPLHTQTCMP